jgi:Fe-S-cluster containining protein
VIPKFLANVRFECVACGKCCHYAKQSDVVVLYEDDVINLARGLGISRDDFVRRHTSIHVFRYKLKDCETVIPRLVLKRTKSRCCFLRGDSCSVHQWKPFQCKVAPFANPWACDKKAWQLFTALCPGIGSGSHVKLSQVKENIQQQQLREQRYQMEIKEPGSKMHNWVTQRRVSRVSVIRIAETARRYLNRMWNYKIH